MKNYFLILLLTLVNFFLPAYAFATRETVIYHDAALGDSYAAVLKEAASTSFTLKGRNDYFISSLAHDASGIEVFAPQA